MNIFALHRDPVSAAQFQCDRHVIKMIVESAQLLSTAHRIIDGTLEQRLSKSGRNQKYYALPEPDESVLYKACHNNHPSAKWTRESSANYWWLYDHFVALCDEYTFRYGKVHATDTKLRDALKKVPQNIPAGTLTSFKLAMGSNPECIDEDDPVGSYRAYYRAKRSGGMDMKWTNRDVPEWF